MFLLFTNVIVFIAELVILVVIHFLTCGCHRDAGDIGDKGICCPTLCKAVSLLLLGVQLPDVGGADPSPCT